MRNLNHLSEVFHAYETFVIDLWGVMHNGISLNPKAVEVIENLNNESKKIVFLSNAPRPSSKVIEFLKKMKMNEKFLSKVVTSGEAAMLAINQNKFGKKFYHLGPSRDNSIFQKVQKNKTELENCDFILCTGLFDEHDDDLDFYENLLQKHTSKKLICTNPDLIVHRGNTEELCAGAVAKTFESLGGSVIYYGKPGESYNIGNNKPEVSVKDVFKILNKITNRRISAKFMPHPKSYPDDEPQRRCPNTNKAKKDLNYNAKVKLEVGLKKFLNWAEDYYKY